MKSKLIISKILLLTIIVFSCKSFTGGADESKKTMPEFVTILEGEGSFAGTIHDDNNIIPVHEVSFTGHTKIGGIRRGSDDSVNVLDLSKLKEIKVIKETYICPRYQDKEYILVQTISINGAITDDLLVPRNIVICAIATETNMEKSWFLRKIRKITIEKDLRKYKAQEFNRKLEIEKEAEENESFFGKIKRGFTKASEALTVK